MSATLCVTADIELDACNDNTQMENAYTTLPMATVQIKEQLLDEETLHSSFEKALSERLTSPYGLWNNSQSDDFYISFLSSAAPAANQGQIRVPQTEPLVHKNHTVFVSIGLQRTIIYSCLALILIMIGFDAMGLLIMMHIH
jgi:hypothetical protein